MVLLEGRGVILVVFPGRFDDVGGGVPGRVLIPECVVPLTTDRLDPLRVDSEALLRT